MTYIACFAGGFAIGIIYMGYKIASQEFKD